MIIQTENLTKYYGQVRGIENLNLQVKEGEIFGFLGPNGAGKTTTIRILLGLIKPTRGRASIFNLDCQKESVKIREEIGNVPGDVNLYSQMKGEEFLDYLDGFRPQKSFDFKKDLAERLSLNLSRKIKAYSKGNKQKLAIIQAFMHNPKLLILDEPSSGLDPLVQQEFYKILKVFSEKGATVFLSSHILSEVEKVCDRVGIIKEGNLVTVENVDDLKHKKVRHMNIAFAQSVNPEEFKLPGIVEVRQNGKFMRITVKGEIDSLIKKLSKFKVEDMDFTTASLEDIFLEYY